MCHNSSRGNHKDGTDRNQRKAPGKELELVAPSPIATARYEDLFVQHFLVSLFVYERERWCERVRREWTEHAFAG